VKEIQDKDHNQNKRLVKPCFPDRLVNEGSRTDRKKGRSVTDVSLSKTVLLRNGNEVGDID
jgi:hypothetical protein